MKGMESSSFFDSFSDIYVKIGHLGLKIIVAIIIFIIGHFVIKLLNRGLRHIFEKRKVDKSISGFAVNFANIAMHILLILTIVDSFGVSITSFAALLASFGVALGMALSGNLQNFAGGLMMLIFKPYKVGDYISAQDSEGFVREILIFHTIIRTYENKIVYIPNGVLSNGVIRNFSREQILRVSWTFGVGYGEDYENVKNVLLNEVLTLDDRILKKPAPSVNLDKLADSSVNILVRAWVKTDDYWSVYYNINEKVYAKFNEKGICIPFPQLTIHQNS